MHPAPPPVSRVRAARRSFQSRDPQTARVWAVAALVATIAVCIGAGVSAGRGLHAPELVASALIAALSAVLLALPARRTAGLTVLAPLAGTATITWLDLLSGDAGVTGQVFFALPVIWAASQLRPGGTVLVAAVTTGADALVALSVLPRQQALTELAYMVTLFALVAGVLGRSATTHERLTERLRAQATTDPVTGLVTRRVLDAATERVVDSPDTGAVLVVIDLDRFKAVNDTFGHLGGDAALAHVASVLSAHCRAEDVVARMGGDELAVLMPGCLPGVARRRALAFVAAVRRTPLVLPSGQVVPVTVSAGMASAPRDARTAQELYACADAALYAAKRAGRDRLATLSAASG